MGQSLPRRDQIAFMRGKGAASENIATHSDGSGARYIAQEGHLRRLTSVDVPSTDGIRHREAPPSTAKCLPDGSCQESYGPRAVATSAEPVPRAHTTSARAGLPFPKTCIKHVVHARMTRRRLSGLVDAPALAH
jgi:hypothetical protein